MPEPRIRTYCDVKYAVAEEDCASGITTYINVFNSLEDALTYMKDVAVLCKQSRDPREACDIRTTADGVDTVIGLVGKRLTVSKKNGFDLKTNNEWLVRKWRVEEFAV